MFTIRDVITEALVRAGLANRRQPPLGNMVESAYRLLKGIAADYSKHNLLQFLRREADLTDLVIKSDIQLLGPNYIKGVNYWDHITDLPIPSTAYWTGPSAAKAWDGNSIVAQIEVVGAGEVAWSYTPYPTKAEAEARLRELGVFGDVIPAGIQPKMIIGTLDPDEPNDWVQVEIANIANIPELYWDVSRDDMANTAVPLGFVSFEDFNNGNFGEYIYTYQEITDRKIELKLKPQFVSLARGGRLKMIYNVAYSFDLDSVMKIPNIYQELFITALTYALACEYPRLSPEHTERLKTNLTNIENSVKTPTRASKFVVRTPTGANGLYNVAQLNSGAFIYPR